jgi:PAS domain S-box-containing protein
MPSRTSAAAAAARPTPATRRRGRPSAVAQHFSELFEGASDMIVINDRKGRLVAANRAAREFGGYTQDDIERGMSLADVIPADEVEAVMALTRHALDGLPISEVYEREVLRRDGVRRFVELRSNVLRRRGRPWALQTIGRDVTEQTEAVAFQAGLLQASQALLTAQSVDEIGRVICEQASRVLQVDGAYLWLRRGDELIGCAAAGPNADAFVGSRRSLSDTLVGRMCRASDVDVLVVNDFARSLYAGEREQTLGVQALLAIPLRRSGPPVGVLIFTDSHNPRRFTRMLHERAMIFGAQITVAIESALAREREEEEGHISAALLRVARDIRESLEATAVLPQIARSAREVLQCDWAAVALWDAAVGALRVTTTEGWPAETAAELQLLEMRPGNLGVVKALMAGRTAEIAEPPEHVELFRRWGMSSLLAVPMSRSGRVVGVLGVGFRTRRAAFAARERRIAEGIAAQAAVAVENARLVEDLQRANRLKSEFLSAMSHELRTPLSAILGYTELLHEGLMGPLGDEQRDTLERILVNGRGLLELINMTLDASRLEAGRAPVELSECSLADILAELRIEFDARAAAGGIALAWPEEPAVPLFTDRAKLKMIARNLVDNALKFTPRGAVTVEVSYPAGGRRLCLSVRDTGIGIPADQLSTVFEMFRQLGVAREPARAGVGLGLHLVRRYSQLLGGDVSVTSTPGAGSIFTIDIPSRLGPAAGAGTAGSLPDEWLHGAKSDNLLG